MSRPDLTKETVFNGYRVNTNHGPNRVAILTAIQNALESMWERCNKRLCVCHYLIWPTDNDKDFAETISSSLQSFRRTMLNHNIKNEYIWVREDIPAAPFPHSHIHVAIILDGKYKQSAQAPKQHLDELISARTGYPSNIHVCQPIERPYMGAKKIDHDIEGLKNAMHWLSYLAKDSHKIAPSGKRTYGYSKCKPASNMIVLNADEGTTQPRENRLDHSNAFAPPSTTGATENGSLSSEDINRILNRLNKEDEIDRSGYNTSK